MLSNLNQNHYHVMIKTQINHPALDMSFNCVLHSVANCVGRSGTSMKVQMHNPFKTLMREKLSKNKQVSPVIPKAQHNPHTISYYFPQSHINFFKICHFHSANYGSHDRYLIWQNKTPTDFFEK